MIGSHLYFELPSGTTLNAFGSYTFNIYNSDNIPFIATVISGSDAVNIINTTLTSIVIDITKDNTDVEINIKNSFNYSDTIKFNTGRITTYFNLKNVTPGQDVYIFRTSGYFDINYDILGLKDSDIIISAPALTKVSERSRFLIDNGENVIKTLVVETSEPFDTTLTAYDDAAGSGSTVILNMGNIPVDEILQRFVNNNAAYGSISFIKPFGPIRPTASIYTNATEETSYIASKINRDSKTITIQYSKNELPREKRTPITISLGSISYSFVLVQPANPAAIYFNYDDSYLPPVLGSAAETTINFNTNKGNTVTISSFNYNPS